MKRFCRIIESKKLNTQILLEVSQNEDTGQWDYIITLHAEALDCVMKLTLGGFKKEKQALNAMDSQTAEGIEDYYTENILTMLN